ncbi:MAG: acyl carrier protein [Pyrinomonadaceae bacterium]
MASLSLENTNRISELQQELAAFFTDELNLSVPSIDVDLVGTGMLDSLGLVELLVYLEHRFGVVVSLEKLELEHFRSILTIAEFILQYGG